jgi:hypothetical protein
MAINDGIFFNHLKDTHSKDPNVLPPEHTLCIKAGNLFWKKISREWTRFNNVTEDIFYACVGEAHVKSVDESKTYDPLLKLYKRRPVMINDNIDVENCEANGTMCEFEGVIFKDGLNRDCLEKIVIDGYYVWCAHVCQLQFIKLRILDGLKSSDEIRYTYLKPENISAKAFFPIPIYPEINKGTIRMWRSMKMRQFPINCANARTIHKLQGRSIDKLVINSWDYTGNWIYVALSRVRELKGLYLRLPLDYEKCRGMSEEVRVFMERLRSKAPLSPVELRR